MAYPPGPPPAPGQWPGYAPPPPPPPPPDAPSSVRTAIGCMWAGAALTVVGGVSTFLFKDEIREQVEEQLRDQGTTNAIDIDTAVNIGLGAAVISTLVGVTLWVVHAVFTAKGQSWARISGSVLYGISLLSSLYSLTQPAPGLSRLLGILSLLAGTAAVVFLWMAPSNAYFRAVDRARRGW